MIPKEKAIELVNKFKYYVAEKDFFGDNVELTNAKQCALIAVDEIISNIYKSSSFEMYYLNNDKMNEVEAINYWQEVKQEIEKL